MKFNISINRLCGRKVNKKLNLIFKSAFLITAFIFLGNFIAAQSGITDQVSKIFYWPAEQGTVAGEFSVRMAQTGVSLGVSGGKFTINGAPTFLLGVSFFDAINETAGNLDSDLQYLQNNHFNLIRVWADWSWQNNEENNNSSITNRNSTVYNTNATLNNRINELKNIIEKAATRGIVVEVVIEDTNPWFYENGEDFNERLTAAREITTALSSYQNVLFDIVNEHDHTGTAFFPASHNQAGLIADEIRSVDSDRIVTISSTGRHIIDVNT